MSISKRNIGRTKNGQEVIFYEMTNKNGLKATVSDLGAAWVGLAAPDKDGVFKDVLLGYDDPETLYNNPGSLGSIVGRNANRIGGGEFSLGGKVYELEKNNNGNNLHSGPNVLQKRHFKAKEGSISGADFVIFELESPDGDQGYPGSLQIKVIYTFTDFNELIIEYILQAGDKDTLANFTCHPYFNLAGHDSGDILNQELWIDPADICEVDDTCLTTGKLIPVKNTPFDFRSPKPIGRDIEAQNQQLRNAGGYDHNFCLDHKLGRMKRAAAARDPKSGRFMEVFTGMPGIQLYTANFMNEEVEAKEGAHYGKYSGFALETQFYPNAINIGEWEQPVIFANEVKYFLTTYKFGIKD